MFGSKITKIVDDVMDYSKYSVINKDEYVVDDHRVTVTMSKFCKNLAASLKYTLLELIPTKKFTLVENNITTDEAKLMTSKVVQQLKMVRIASDCPYNSFRLFVRYKPKPIFDNKTGKSFMYINTRDIELYNEGLAPQGRHGEGHGLGQAHQHVDRTTDNTKIKHNQDNKYFNAADFCAIEFNKFIKIEGKIEAHNSYGSNSIHKYITTEYKQRYTIESNDVMEYYNGEFEFHYIDNRDAEDVLREAFTIIIGVVDDILDREDKFKLSLNSYSVDVKYDRSGVIANLIDAYILMQTKNRVIKTNRESINGITKINFIDIPIEELSVILDKALKALKTELSNVVKDL